MNLIDEAVIIEIFGIRMYAFGAYVAVGALCSLLTMLMLRKAFDLKTGTVPLTFLLSAICGVVVSRLAFCLLNQELGRMMPLYSWFQAPGGGWSMFGLIGGVFLGGWISSKIMKEKAGSIMDMLSLSILPLIVSERIGENRIEDFDISRVLQSQAIANSFLATGDEYTRALKTYYVAAAVCAVIFAVLLLTFMRRKKNGDVAVMFLLIFGAASIILESLRYDFFLSISFVGLQQVAAALMLALGVILAAKRSNRPKSGLAIAAYISLPLMVGAVIGLEFALDRTAWNKILIYVLMIVVVSVPAALGLKLLGKGSKDSE